MIFLDSVLVTQSDLRHHEAIDKMAAFVCKGGFWTKETLESYAKRHDLPRVSPLIQISEFEDGQRFLHDGHHRLLSTYLGCRGYLRDDEYVLTKWTYPLYLELAPEKGWFTPFDPRIHLRAADFGLFKKEARRIYESDPEKLLSYVEGPGRMLYRMDRGSLRTIADLAATINMKQLDNCNVG